MVAARSRWLLVAAVLAAALPTAGRAQSGGGTGGYFLLGGGVTEFTNSALKDRFKTGGTWQARFGAPIRSLLAGEVSYVGAFHAGKAGPDVLQNGAEGILRLQAPMGEGTLIEPFAFAGIGWSHVSLRHAPSGTTTRSDNIGTVPLGAGVTFGFGNFLVDARFTYRATFSEDLPIGSGGSKDLKQWDLGASIGWQF